MVLDTTTLIAALRSATGASRRLLSAALDRQLKIVASVTLVIEYQAVMTRPEHVEASGLSMDEVGDLLDAIVGVAEPVVLAFLWRPAVRDPDDDMVLEAAVNGRAEAIVTFNVRDFAKAAESFGIEVLTPGLALRRLEAQREEK